MAPIDNGEEKLERVTSEIGRAAGQTTVRATARITGDISKKVLAESLRAAATSVKWTAAAVQRPGGKVSMKELSELPSKTGREVLSLDDKDVMRALETNLKKRGVHYAIEREKIDGKIQHILHVRGDDSSVVADSLERAAESVDAKRERKQERSAERETPKQERSDDVEAPKQKESSSKTQDQPKQKQPAAESKDRQQSAKPKQPEKPEPTATKKRSKAETAQMQKEIRQKVKARTDKIKAEAPKKSPKLDVPTPGLKR